MKKTILTLLTIMCSLVINAQDTLGVDSMIRNNVVIETDGTLTMVGVDIGLPIMGRGLLNANVTIPQKISGDYNIIHYMAVGYSSSDNNKDEYLLSYGIGIPLYSTNKGKVYGYLIDAYHYRPTVVVRDIHKNRDFRQRRVKFAYRVNKYEISTTYTIRYSLMFGFSHSLR